VKQLIPFYIPILNWLCWNNIKCLAFDVSEQFVDLQVLNFPEQVIITGWIFHAVTISISGTFAAHSNCLICVIHVLMVPEFQHSFTFSKTGCNIQGVSRLVDITAGGDFLGLCDQKRSYKHVSDFGQLQSYDCLKLRIWGNDYWQ